MAVVKTKRQIWEEIQRVLDRRINADIEREGAEQYEQLEVTKSKSEVIKSKEAPKKTLFEKVTGLKPSKKRK